MRKTLVYHESGASQRKPMAAMALVGLLVLVGLAARYLFLRKPSEPARILHSNMVSYDPMGAWVNPPMWESRRDKGIVLFVDADHTFESWRVRPTAHAANILSHAYLSSDGWISGQGKRI